MMVRSFGRYSELDTPEVLYRHFKRGPKWFGLNIKNCALRYKGWKTSAIKEATHKECFEQLEDYFDDLRYVYDKGIISKAVILEFMADFGSIKSFAFGAVDKKVNPLIFISADKQVDCLFSLDEFIDVATERNTFFSHGNSIYHISDFVEIVKSSKNDSFVYDFKTTVLSNTSYIATANI